MTRTAKRRQHHVWQHYLESWAIDGKLSCLRANRVFETGAISVAVERDFYKLLDFQQGDKELLRFLLIDSAQATKRLHEDFLSRLLFPIEFVNQNRGTLHDLDKIDDALREYQTNVIEDYHMKVEDTFTPLLERAKRGDISFYQKDDECISFIKFICTQMLRTKGVKFNVTEILRVRSGIDVSRIWDIMSIMLAVNAGGSIFVERKRRRLELIRNETGVDFITGDQPAFNLLNSRKPEEQFSIYYPLSPTLALILSEVDQEPLYSTDTLTAADVETLNTKIFGESHSQVFARRAVSLEPFQRHQPASIPSGPSIGTRK